MNLNRIVFITLILLPSIILADTSSKCPNEDGYFYTNYRERNPTKGGFISNQAYVEDSDSVFISPSAAVCGSSSITGSVKIFGNAKIVNATISGNVNIKDNATVISATISDNAIISGYAYIEGSDVTIKDKAQVNGNAKVSGDSNIGGTAIIGGYANINTGTYTNEVIKPTTNAQKSPEEVARENFKKDLLSASLKIQNTFDQQNSYEKKVKIEQLLAIWIDYHSKIVSTDISLLKSLLLSRKNADFSQIQTIDLQIKNLNIEIKYLLDNVNFSFLQNVWEFLESNKERSLALNLEKIRLDFYVYGITYAGEFDSSRGPRQKPTIEDAEKSISTSYSNMESTVNDW